MLLRARLRPAYAVFAAGLLAGAAPAVAQTAPAPAPAPAAPAPAAPVTAARVTEAQAQALEAGLRAWLTGQVGTAVDVAALPLRVVAGDDGYRIEIPFGGPARSGVSFGDGVVSARVKQLDDHRWAIEDMRLPSPFSVALDPSLQAAGKDVPSSMTLKIAEQDMHGILDTSLATTSSFDTRLRGYSVEIQGAQGVQTTQVDGVTGHMVLQPTSDGRLTMTGQSSLDKYAAHSLMPDGSALDIGIDRMRTSVTASNVDMAGAGALVHALAGLAASVQEAAKVEAGKVEVTEADKAGARAVVRALAGLMDGMTSEQTYEGIHVALGGQTGSLRKLSIGFDMAAPAGKADLAWRIDIEGLQSPMIPEGVMRDYLPKRIALTPHIGGIPKHDLEDLILRSIDDPNAADNAMASVLALLDKGPLRLAVEDVAFDVGPARLTGGGGVKVAALDDISGGGEFRATGLEALIKQANTTPELKSAAPFLIFLKGIGRQVGAATVWKIRYADNKVLVNDTDLSAMMPGGK
ncbi:MAG: hypothetical protein BGP12_21920 [Rhodospirillales bacterium 70-18]|nr:MAG: hypothetical protein BGP12_21920 [Rhodospirillales bacterium 70-18]